MQISDVLQAFTHAASAGATATPSGGNSTAEVAAEVTVDVVQVLGAGAAGLVVGFLIAVVGMAILRYGFRRAKHVQAIIQPLERAVPFTVAILGVMVSMNMLYSGLSDSQKPSFASGVQHIILILLFVGITWMALGVARGLFDVVLARTKVREPSRVRRVETQVQILRRVVAAVIVVLGIAAILLTFPSMRAAGASIFASAGLISVVAGIAAQSTLGNVFAGLQLAFSDSIRVGDVVNWKGEFTYVEEITLTYVVLAVWDGRRLIVPSSELTTQTFENWTRKNPGMQGVVSVHVDWNAPLGAMRAELARILASTDLWDGKPGTLVVADAGEDSLRVDIFVSSANPSTIADLKNYVREGMVVWLREHSPISVPHKRIVEYTGSQSDLDALSEANDESAHIEGTSGDAAAVDGDAGKGGGTARGGKAGRSAARAQGRSSRTTETGARAGQRMPGVKAGGTGVTVSAADATETTVLNATEILGALPRRIPVEQRMEKASTPAIDHETTAGESSRFSTSELAKNFSGPGEDVQRERTRSFLIRTGQISDQLSDAEIEAAVDEEMAREKAENGPRVEGNTNVSGIEGADGEGGDPNDSAGDVAADGE
ncbi:mechanosensitive ion channel family protein [Neoactinobaculum massilliense]|uniref:mechanosensitive ion channel family protein n=1 Tax=Neoactinobaculum massilliense TaxID=2364794 RepID=UPI000F527B95|nr:mechanosensitive ion channel domain-containing protein [Neoactinobaculum massilliense]